MVERDDAVELAARGASEERVGGERTLGAQSQLSRGRDRGGE